MSDLNPGWQWRALVVLYIYAYVASLGWWIYYSENLWIALVFWFFSCVVWIAAVYIPLALLCVFMMVYSFTLNFIMEGDW